MNGLSEVNIDDSEGLNINTPTGILYNIISNEPTTFNKDSLFKYLYEHKDSTTIPDLYMNDYTTETNFNSQTPLMYSVIINNLNFVKILLKHGECIVKEFIIFFRQNLMKLLEKMDFLLIKLGEVLQKKV